MSRLGCAANPKLHVLLSRCVDDEFLSFLVIRGSGLDASRVRAVRQFCQGEASDVNELFTISCEMLVLISTEVDDRLVIQLQIDCELRCQVIVVQEQWSAHGYEVLEIVDDLREGLDLIDFPNHCEHLGVDFFSKDFSCILFVIGGHKSLLVPEDFRHLLIELEVERLVHRLLEVLWLKVGLAHVVRKEFLRPEDGRSRCEM